LVRHFPGPPFSTPCYLVRHFCHPAFSGDPFLHLRLGKTTMKQKWRTFSVRHNVVVMYDVAAFAAAAAAATKVYAAANARQDSFIARDSPINRDFDIQQLSTDESSDFTLFCYLIIHRHWTVCDIWKVYCHCTGMRLCTFRSQPKLMF